MAFILFQSLENSPSRPLSPSCSLFPRDQICVIPTVCSLYFARRPATAGARHCKTSELKPTNALVFQTECLQPVSTFVCARLGDNAFQITKSPTGWAHQAFWAFSLSRSADSIHGFVSDLGFQRGKLANLAQHFFPFLLFSLLSPAKLFPLSVCHNGFGSFEFTNCNRIFLLPHVAMSLTRVMYLEHISNYML